MDSEPWSADDEKDPTPIFCEVIINELFNPDALAMQPKEMEYQLLHLYNYGSTKRFYTRGFV